MRAMLVPLLMLLAGCPPKTPIDNTVEVKADPYPALLCPEGTEKKGAAPPDGYKVWCMRFLPTGSWINDGGHVTFYDSGEVKEKGEYRSGSKEGTWELMYETGETQREEIFVDNKSNGTSTEYHPNGNKKSEGEKVNGRESGGWTYWHDNGTKKKEGVWKDGEPDGEWLEYDAEGNKTQIRQYKFGRLLTHKEL